MIGNDEIARTVEAYLERHDGERTRLAALTSSLALRLPVAERSTVTGHVTCSAVLINSARKVLHVRHNTLGRWLRPGGHLEVSDTSLLGAALREVEEESGIRLGDAAAQDLLPLDIDVHSIPANLDKGEPDHQHFDLRYAFTLSVTPSVVLQVEEVNAFDWRPVEQVEPVALREKLLLTC